MIFWLGVLFLVATDRISLLVLWVILHLIFGEDD